MICGNSQSRHTSKSQRKLGVVHNLGRHTLYSSFWNLQKKNKLMHPIKHRPIEFIKKKKKRKKLDFFFFVSCAKKFKNLRAEIIIFKCYVFIQYLSSSLKSNDKQIEPILTHLWFCSWFSNYFIWLEEKCIIKHWCQNEFFCPVFLFS